MLPRTQKILQLIKMNTQHTNRPINEITSETDNRHDLQDLTQDTDGNHLKPIVYVFPDGSQECDNITCEVPVDITLNGNIPEDIEEQNDENDLHVPYIVDTSDLDIESDTDSEVNLCTVTSAKRLRKVRKLDSNLIMNNDNQDNCANSERVYSRKKRAERKKNRNLGQTYVTAKGKEKKARRLTPLSNCRNKCKDKVAENTRKEIFEEYWSLGDRNKRVAYIVSLIDSKTPASSRKRTADPEKEKFRMVTHMFHLKVNGERIRVCRKCFMETFDETNMFVTLAINNRNSNTSGTITDDQRGRDPSVNKHNDETINEVKKHIRSFPLYESHYTRRESTRKYLPPHLNLQIMYKLYCEGKEVPVSRTIYEREFHKMNISFKKPKVDTCHKCDILANKLKITSGDDEKDNIKKEIRAHHTEADCAYLMKSVDKNLAKSDSSFKCFTFDLQQCLPTPYVNSSVSFYKRQLWTFNLTLHELGKGDVTCYMWHEAEGGRGGNQIATCVYKQLISLPPDVSKVTLYSDSCGGQNKNSHVSVMFLVALQNNPNLEIIDHKFMVSGHSHMECDIDHGLIEKQKKRLSIPINHPHDWYQLVRSTGKKTKFNVVELLHGDFFNFSDLLKSNFVMRKKDTSGNVFNWLNVKWFRYTKEKGIIFFKTSLNDADPFKSLNILRRGQTHARLAPKKLYNSTIPISEQKKKDILDLLPLISPAFHDFYINLKTADIVDVLLDGNESSDECTT